MELYGPLQIREEHRGDIGLIVGRDTGKAIRGHDTNGVVTGFLSKVGLNDFLKSFEELNDKFSFTIKRGYFSISSQIENEIMRKTISSQIENEIMRKTIYGVGESRFSKPDELFKYLDNLLVKEGENPITDPSEFLREIKANRKKPELIELS